MIGSYVIHYANGQRKEIPIIYGQDVRSWWVFPNEPATMARASVAWSGTSASASVRLYKRTWENPLPNVEIKSLDFISSMANPSPLLIAVTAEP